MAANERMKDPSVLVTNESLSLSLATSHSTRHVGFSISSCVSVSMVTLQLCMQSTALRKGEEVQNVHLALDVEGMFAVHFFLQEMIFHICGAPGTQRYLHQGSLKVHQGQHQLPAVSSREKCRNTARLLWQICRVLPATSKL